MLSISKIICNDCLNCFNVPISLSSEIESEHDVVAVFRLIHSYARHFD